MRYKVEPPPRFRCACEVRERQYQPDPECAACGGTGKTSDPKYKWVDGRKKRKVQ